MQKQIVSILRCPECFAQLSDESLSGNKKLSCINGHNWKEQNEFFALICGEDIKKYSWLEKLNLEDRPEYHLPDKKVYGKEKYHTSGYLRRFFDELRPQKSDVVIDLGCGRGQISDPLSELVDAVLSVDLVPENLLDVQNENKVLATADNIPVIDDSVDLVIFTDVMEHLPPASQDKVLSEIFRVLKPGGRLFVSYPGNNLPNLSGVHILNIAVFFIRLFDKRINYFNWVEPPAHINMSYPWRVSKAFREAGFSGRIRPYTNKFLSLPERYHKLAGLLNLPVIRNFFNHQLHGILIKPHR